MLYGCMSNTIRIPIRLWSSSEINDMNSSYIKPGKMKGS